MMKHCVIDDSNLYIVEESERGRVVQRRPHETNIGHMGDIYKLVEPHKIYSVWLMPGASVSDRCLDLCKATSTEDFHFWYQEAPVEEGRPGCPYAKIRAKSTSFVPFMHLNCPSSGVWCEDVEGQKWDVKTPGNLLATIMYLQEALQEDVLCSPGHVGKRMMQALSRERLAEKLDVEELPYKEMSLDLLWHRQLTRDETTKSYLYMADKNSQYLGAASSVKLGVGEYIYTREYQSNKPGIWRIEWEAGLSPFDGKILPPPFSNRAWASTDLVEAARSCGCIVRILEGYYWPQSATILDKWSKKIWEARASLSAPATRFRDDLARKNAYRTIKLIGNATIGRLNREYSGELYRPDINRFIISRARANALYSLKKWHSMGCVPAMVYRDAYYFFSDCNALNNAVPGILDHSQELRGYKEEYRFTVSPMLIKAFEEEKTSKLNSYLKKIRMGR